MSQKLKVSANLLVSTNGKGDTILKTSPLTVQHFDGPINHRDPRFTALGGKKLSSENMVYLDFPQLFKHIPDYPLHFTGGNLYFLDMHKVLNDSIVPFKENLERLREQTLLGFIVKRTNELKFHYDALLESMRNGGLGEIRINGYFGVNTGTPSTHITSNQELPRYVQNHTPLKEYGVSVLSYQSDSKIAVHNGIEFLCRNVIVESFIVYKDQPAPTFDEFATAVFEQYKKTNEAIMVILETMLTAYNAVDNADEEMFICKDNIIL